MGRIKTGMEYQLELIETKKELDTNLTESEKEINDGISELKNKHKEHTINVRTNGYFKNKLIKYQRKYNLSQTQIIEYLLSKLKDI